MERMFGSEIQLTLTVFARHAKASGFIPIGEKERGTY